MYILVEIIHTEFQYISLIEMQKYNWNRKRIEKRKTWKKKRDLLSRLVTPTGTKGCASHVGTGFEISAKFRRISAKFFVSARYREKIFRYFRKISFWKFKIQKNSSENRRKSPKFRNGIPFPPITGISPENEMVNPA